MSTRCFHSIHDQKSRRDTQIGRRLVGEMVAFMSLHVCVKKCTFSNRSRFYTFSRPGTHDMRHLIREFWGVRLECRHGVRSTRYCWLNSGVGQDEDSEYSLEVNGGPLCFPHSCLWPLAFARRLWTLQTLAVNCHPVDQTHRTVSVFDSNPLGFVASLNPTQAG